VSPLDQHNMSTTSGDTFDHKELQGVIPPVHLNVEKPIDTDVSERTSEIGVDAVADEKQEPTEAVAAPREITGWKWGLVVISILSSIFLFALDNTVVADIQPAIIANFGEIQKLPWLTGAFLIGSASTNLVWGKIYGQMEAKTTYILSVLVFEVGSALCGAAPSMNALIVGRVIAGVGGSGMYVGVMTLLSVTTSIQERPMYVGLTGLLWGIGTVLGPIIGGAFTDSSAGWRWAFYINL
jgi:MFS family permease